VDAPSSGRLRLGRNLINRVGDVTEGRTEALANKLEITYQYDAYLGKFRSYRCVDDSNNNRCKLSNNRYGMRQWQQRVVPLMDVQEENTADQIINWVVHAYSEIPLKAKYLATRDVLRYSPGDYMEITDENMGWTNKKFLIESIMPGTLDTEVSFREHI